jgi:cobalamin biosynthetic protein CobC
MGEQSYGPPASASIANPAAEPAAGGPVRDHGGALDAAETRFGKPAGGWVDLSTGINPWPWKPGEIGADAWNRLPDRAANDRLRHAAARCFGAAPEALMAAPGSQALIQAVPRIVRRGHVAILGFTYAEHARCWRLAGHRVTVEQSLEAAAGADCVIVTNPNNPDGRQVEPARLLELSQTLAARGGLLVVDEAFADVTPDLSVAGEAGQPGLCVLRSFGKFFGLAGLRLGFALGTGELVRRLEEHLGPWAVAGPALEIGAAAMDDADWIAATRVRLARAASDLDFLIESHGLAVVGGTDLFRLARTPHAADLFEHLGRQGILARSFDAKPDWLRFGLPPDAAAWERLRAALASFNLAA